MTSDVADEVPNPAWPVSLGLWQKQIPDGGQGWRPVGVTVPLPSPGGHQGAADRQLEPRGLMEGGSLSFFLLHLGVGVAAGLPSPFPSTGPNFTRKTSPVTSGHQLLPLMVIKFTLQPTIFSVLGVATLNILGGGPPFAKENALSSFTLFWQINPPAS